LKLGCHHNKGIGMEVEVYELYEIATEKDIVRLKILLDFYMKKLKEKKRIQKMFFLLVYEQ